MSLCHREVRVGGLGVGWGVGVERRVCKNPPYNFRSIYVCKNPLTVFDGSFWNFLVVLDMVWRRACYFRIYMYIRFVLTFSDVLFTIYSFYIYMCVCVCVCACVCVCVCVSMCLQLLQFYWLIWNCENVEDMTWRCTCKTGVSNEFWYHNLQRNQRRTFIWINLIYRYIKWWNFTTWEMRKLWVSQHVTTELYIKTCCYMRQINWKADLKIEKFWKSLL